MTSKIAWSHPSVLQLLEEADTNDPFAEITRRARGIALTALEQGWKGPPFDPFDLAEQLDVEVVPRDDLNDARLVRPDEGLRIEFNPHRRPARLRFSIAHELGHMLFTDHGEQVRYRNQSHDEGNRDDNWQLEILCNVAAAELLMPAGSFPVGASDNLSLPHLLDLRALYGVSTEALLRRVIKLTERPACLFAAARSDTGGFRLDYEVISRAWDLEPYLGEDLSGDTVLSRCTAVGFSTEGVEEWPGASSAVRVQAVGVPPYPGDRFPRVVGLVQPVEDREPVYGFRYVRGDATQPETDTPVIIAHVVNDTARRWGGPGFARQLANRFPAASTDFTTWASQPDQLKLGAVHLFEARPSLWIASLVAQVGYGDSARPRIRLPHLREALEALGRLASERDAEVHMPPIGTGQGRIPWPTVRDLIIEEVSDRGAPVTVHILPEEPMPDDSPAPHQLSLI